MFEQHAVLWSVDSFTVQVTQHLCISWLWETLPPIPGVEAEHWTPPPPGLVYLSSHNALGNKGREGRLSCLKEQQQGSFSQMDMYLLWDISSSLISHCNENDKKKQFSSEVSVQQRIWHHNPADFPNIVFHSGECVQQWMLTGNILFIIAFALIYRIYNITFGHESIASWQ